MKKMMCGVLCAALLACSAGAAAAGSYTVTVDGAALDLSGKTPFVSQDKVMVPLRPVAEALGYTVTWTAEDAQRVEIDNGVVHTWVTIGVDSYCRTSSTALGMGAPQSFGAAPVAMDNTTYVPVDLFAMMGHTVETDGTDITLSAMESQTQIPNPIVAYDTLEKAVAAAGVKAVLPAFPAEWRQVEFSVIGGTLLQVIYTDGTDTAVFRAAAGDTSGDYNAYPWTAETEADDVTVTLKGQEEDAVLLAVWTDGQYSYALACSAPLMAEEATAMASGVAPLE